MADKKKMEEYILRQQRVTIPAIQQRFSADYYTVYTLVNDLVKRDLLFYDKGLEYVTAGAGRSPAPPESLDDVFARVSGETVPREEKKPAPAFPKRRGVRSPVQAFFDGLFGNAKKYDQDLLHTLYGDYDGSSDRLSDEEKRLKALIEEDEGTDDGGGLDDADFDMLFAEDDDDYDEDCLIKPMTDEEIEEIVEAHKRRIVDAAVMDSELGDGIADTLNVDELSLILPCIESAESCEPKVADSDLIACACPRQRIGKDVLRSVQAVRDLFFKVFDFCLVKAEMIRIDIGYSVVGFTVRAASAEVYPRMKKYVTHYALGLFRRASIEENERLDLVKLVVPFPEGMRKTLPVSYFARTIKYPRRHGLYLAIGKTHEGQDVVCDLRDHNLLIASDNGVEGNAYLHGAIGELAARYSPEKLRIFSAAFCHADFLPYGGLPHAYTPRTVTTKHGLFAMLDILCGLTAPPKEGETRPQNILLVMDGLPPMDETEREQFADKLEKIARARAAGIRVILSVNDASEETLPPRIIGLFGARLNFRLTGAAGERPEFRPAREGISVLCEPSDLLVGSGDGYYREGEDETRVQAVISETPRATVRRIATGANKHFDFYPISEPPAEMVRLEPPDKVYLDGLKLCVDLHSASISYIQRRCGIGYSRAGMIVEWMACLGYISEFTDCRARRVFLTEELFTDLYGDVI